MDEALDKDREVVAIEQVYEVVKRLDYGEQRRLVDWLSSRIESDQIPKATAGPA